MKFTRYEIQYHKKNYQKARENPIILIMLIIHNSLYQGLFVLAVVFLQEFCRVKLQCV